MLSDLLADVGESGASQTVPKTRQGPGDATAHQDWCSTPPHPNRNHSDRQSTKLTTDTLT